MYLQDLSEKIWKTKNARFIASKRMKRSNNSSTVSVALLSASIIAVNMLAFLDIGETDKTIITIVTVALSTFALVMSLLISHLRYEYRENNYHQCGIELDNLNQRLKIRVSELCANNNVDNIVSPKEDNVKYLDEYNTILSKFNLNHTDFDYNYSMIKAEDEKKIEIRQRIYYWIRWNIFDISVLYWFLAMIPIIGVMIAFFYMLTAQR